jgi:flagellar M-ring protein FliF
MAVSSDAQASPSSSSGSRTQDDGGVFISQSPNEPSLGGDPLTRLRQILSGLSDLQRFMVGAGVLLVGVLLASAAFLAPTDQEKRVLYSNLSDTDGAAIIAALQQLNVPYEFASGGAAILVPEDKLYETRLNLAGQGLPKAANVGFEILDTQGFGTSQFVEQVNYVRGLEGELARSISSLDQIKSARVHLVIPKQTAFVRKPEPTSASVVVELYPGRVLGSDQAFAITRLVSTAVPRLTQDNVSVVDTEGVMLMPSLKQAEDLPETQLAYSAELEAVLNRRVATILEPIAGEKGYRTQVAVDIDFSERERTSEIFGKNADPSGQSKRSEKISESNQRDQFAAGIPGALSNQPIAPPEAPIVNEFNLSPEFDNGRDLVAPGPIETDAGLLNPDDGGRTREQITNYEVDRVIESIKEGKGEIRRVSVAVVMDLKTINDPVTGGTRKEPFSENELVEIRSLVQDAVGFDASRGDSVSVVNMAFWQQPPAAIPPVISEGDVNELLRYALIALGVLFLSLVAYFALLRPIHKKLRELSQPPLGSQEDIRDVLVSDSIEADQALDEENFEDLNDDEDDMMEDPSVAAARLAAEREADKRKAYEELLEYAKTFSAENPEKVSLILQSWMSSREKTPGNLTPKPKVGDL